MTSYLDENYILSSFRLGSSFWYNHVPFSDTFPKACVPLLNLWKLQNVMILSFCKEVWVCDINTPFASYLWPNLVCWVKIDWKETHTYYKTHKTFAQIINRSIWCKGFHILAIHGGVQKSAPVFERWKRKKKFLFLGGHA